MKLVKRTLKFTAGGIAGAAAGAVAALLLAPDSGQNLQRKLRERIREAKLAGTEAKAARENELIRKYRLNVKDHEALTDAERHAADERAQAVVALGLGLNAPGAIASQEISGRSERG